MRVEGKTKYIRLPKFGCTRTFKTFIFQKCEFGIKKNFISEHCKFFENILVKCDLLESAGYYLAHAKCLKLVSFCELFWMKTKQKKNKFSKH